MNSQSKLLRSREEGAFWKGFVQHRSPISTYGDMERQAAPHPKFQWNICWNTKQSPLWRPKPHVNTGRLVDHTSFHRNAPLDLKALNWQLLTVGLSCFWLHQISRVRKARGSEGILPTTVHERRGNPRADLGHFFSFTLPHQCVHVSKSFMFWRRHWMMVRRSHWIYCVYPVNWQWVRASWSCVDKPSFIPLASFLWGGGGGRGRRLPWYLYILSLSPHLKTYIEFHWLAQVGTMTSLCMLLGCSLRDHWGHWVQAVPTCSTSNIHISLEVRQRYFSYCTILAAIVSQNYLVLVFVGYRIIMARYVTKWGIAQMRLCETKCQGGVSHHLGEVLPSLKKHRAIRGIAAKVSQYRTIWGH